MGFYTELFFNEIWLADDGLKRLRDSAVEVLKDPSCAWSYMLDYIYVEDNDDHTLDLGLSAELTEELKTYRSSSLVPWDRIDDPEYAVEDGADPEDRTYWLRWNPYNGAEGKWYDVEAFVAWVCAFCRAGRILQLTCEEDGGLWGYEIGEGEYCELELTESSPWKKAVPHRTKKAATKKATTAKKAAAKKTAAKKTAGKKATKKPGG